ncbi:hypothetical protein ACFWUZ_12690 [Streptomyces sp. NPDC058646]|uniref:hypothetical protein n=1 Tax=Streptomyces sp. NPDC058646 TaxID=3346574 RepID=UPI00365643D0
MHTIQFELTHAGSGRGRLGRMDIHAWAGSVPGFGPVELTSPAETDAQREGLGAWVSGQAVPPMTFWGYGFRNLPRLAQMTLTVDGWTGKVKRRHLAVTPHGRALRIEVAGRAYRYRVLDGKCRHELRRDGAVVTMTRSRWRHPQSISGIAQGGFDGLDIGLAVLMEGAYTRNLSFSGALWSWPGRFLSRMDLPDI